MTQHTPGPWQVSPAPSSIKGAKTSLSIIRNIGGYVATAYPGGMQREEAEANARLIAAAPDLLEALRQCLGFDNHVYGNPPSCCFICKAISKVTRLP